MREREDLDPADAAQRAGEFQSEDLDADAMAHYKAAAAGACADTDEGAGASPAAPSTSALQNPLTQVERPSRLAPASQSRVISAAAGAAGSPTIAHLSPGQPEPPVAAAPRSTGPPAHAGARGGLTQAFAAPLAVSPAPPAADATAPPHHHAGGADGIGVLASGHVSLPATTEGSTHEAAENSAPVAPTDFFRGPAEVAAALDAEMGTSPRSAECTVVGATDSTARTAVSPRGGQQASGGHATATAPPADSVRTRISTSIILTRYSVAVGLAGDGPNGRLVLTIHIWSCTDAAVDVLGSHLTAVKAHLMSHGPFVSRLRAMGMPRICVVANVPEHQAAPWTHALTGFRVAGYSADASRSGGHRVRAARLVQLQWMWAVEEGEGHVNAASSAAGRVGMESADNAASGAAGREVTR